MKFSYNTKRNLIKFAYNIYVTLDHKTSHKGQVCEIEICKSSERWINENYIDVCFFMIGQDCWLRYNYLKIWNLCVQTFLEKIAFKDVQIKFLAMHIDKNLAIVRYCNIYIL